MRITAEFSHQGREEAGSFQDEQETSSVLNLGMEVARTGTGERPHAGTDVKINLPQDHAAGLFDSHFPHGGSDVVARVFAKACGSDLDRQWANYQQAHGATVEQGRAFMDRQIQAALDEAMSRLGSFYVQERLPGNFQPPLSLGFAKLSYQEGSVCAHVFRAGDTRVYLYRGKELYTFGKERKEGLHPRKERETEIKRVEVLSGDRLVFVNDEVERHLSSKELSRLLNQHPNAKGAEQAIQQATVAAFARQHQKGNLDVDVSAVVFEVPAQAPPAVKEKKASSVLSALEYEQAQERLIVLRQEIARLERDFSVAKERRAPPLEQAELAAERWQLERQEAQLTYQIAFSRIRDLREKYPPQFRPGTRVRHGGKTVQKEGWIVLRCDDRMVLPPQGTFNDHFGMYEIRPAGGDQTEWVNQFQLEGWQGGTPTDQHQRALGFEAHRQLRSSMAAFYHAQEQWQLWKAKQQSLAVEQARQTAHQEGERGHVTQEMGEMAQVPSAAEQQRKEIDALREEFIELQNLEHRRTAHALSSVEEARRRQLSLVIAAYGGVSGVERLLRESKHYQGR